MAWTTEDKIRSLMRLPWGITAEAGEDPGEFVVRVDELPSTVVVGTRKEIDVEFWKALRATFECYLEFGDTIPLPRGVSSFPWESKRPSLTLERAEATRRGGEPETARTAFSQQIAVVA